MKYAAALLIALAASSKALPNGSCSRDACLSAASERYTTRSLFNTNGCSSFFYFTVTSGLTTETTTATATVTTTVAFSTSATPSAAHQHAEPEPAASVFTKALLGQVARAAETTAPSKPTTFTPTDMPSYASTFCSAPAAFSSACSCLGIKHRTTTVPSGTTTVAAPDSTVTVTASATPTPPCGDGPSYFYLSLYGAKQYEGQFAYLFSRPNDTRGDVVGWQAGAGERSAFSVDPATGALSEVSLGAVARVGNGTAASVYFADKFVQAHEGKDGEADLACGLEKVSDNVGIVKCRGAQGQNTWEMCPYDEAPDAGFALHADGSQRSKCVRVELVARPACLPLKAVPMPTSAGF